MIRPVILSGGSGTRLWPLSRAAYPKQLMPLVGKESLLQETVQRVTDPALFSAPFLICNDEHRFLVAEQLRALRVKPEAIVLEPLARNTAAAVAAAALMAEPSSLLLILPSDHYIQDTSAFRAAAAKAAKAAEAGALVTFGIHARSPETAYGYIRRGEVLTETPDCLRVAGFVEKPDVATATKYLASGEYFWNAGMFLFRADRFLAELAEFEPAIKSAVEKSVAGATRDLDFIRLEKAAFAEAPAISIDYAVMEKTRHAAVVPVEMGWTDVGSWSALWDVTEKDANGNALIGDVVSVDVKDSYIRGESRLVTAIGLENIVLIETVDAVMAVSRDRAQDLKLVIDKLSAAGRDERLSHRRVYRPWGTYETVDIDQGFQVKRIVVNPGARLSLQKHAHRAEHWVVVRGMARVTRDREVFDLVANQSAYIPLGAVHRLENPGKEPLHLIEVQSGDYLGEDDIVRLEDHYGRA
ncbi:MAG TPA: mannose-1-phosphate guanylyltransferase/mannose-6-phosphate isomerase [Dongiaceae bacterium]|jgi:mannose-1-phosphate guanylyltransferase/mannose-6-phosphate isomerase|nr:mannose-1-phosphate guanylyltransferase/mannose-6-phosphate isomerase [Dongiaceae bacterium]